MAPGGTAVWLPGLGDRWPQHSRLCLPRAHIPICHLYLGGGGGQGRGLSLHPPPSPEGVYSPSRSPRPFPGPSPLLPTPLGAPSPPRHGHPQTSQLASAGPHPPRPGCGHADPPLKGSFEQAALSTPRAIPIVGVLTQCLGAADMTACHVQSPKASREDNLLPVAAQLPQPHSAQPTCHPRALGSRASCTCPHPQKCP